MICFFLILFLILVTFVFQSETDEDKTHFFVQSNVFYDTIASNFTEKYRADILLGRRQPLLTLFTTWTPAPSKSEIHVQVVRNWALLKPFVIPVMFSNSPDVKKSCEQAGWKTLNISKTMHSVPVLKYMYGDVKKYFNTTLYAFSNGDILYTDGLIKTLITSMFSLTDTAKPVLIVGRRTNVYNVSSTEASSWDSIQKTATIRGKVFGEDAIDYFISSKSFSWSDVDDVIIGRPAYDNWLVLLARKRGYLIVDATKSILAVHQTDSAGNSEGHTHSHRDYNRNLLRTKYGVIRYAAGYISCAEYSTHVDTSSDTIRISKISKNILPRHCKLF